MMNTTVTSRDYFFHKLKFHIVGMSKEAQGKSVNRVVAPTVEDGYKKIDTINIAIHSITTTLKADFLFRNFLLLL